MSSAPKFDTPFRYRPLELHVAGLLKIAAICAPIVIWGLVSWVLLPRARWQGKLILTVVPTVVFALLFLALRRQGKKAESAFDAANAGDAPFQWTLTGEALRWYRDRRKQKYWRWYLWWVALPMILGLGVAVTVTLYNLSAGVSAAHCLKMGAAILITTAALAGGIGILRWLLTYPMLRAYRFPELHVIFSAQYILAGDLTIEIDRWSRSRDITTVERDGHKLLLLRFTRNSTQQGRLVVNRLEAEIPVPPARAADAERVASEFELNAGRELHKSVFGWYGKR